MQYGRKVIYTSETEINGMNLPAVLTKAMTVHPLNKADIDYLYRYYKGDQPIKLRTKEVRPEICNKIAVNIANSIVSFIVGYRMGEPIQYVGRKNRDVNAEALSILNGYMNAEDKASRDMELVEWQQICGTAYRMVLPDAEPDESPFEIYTLDPRQTFVIYGNDIGHTPLAGVYYIENEITGRTEYSVYTKNYYYKLEDGKVVDGKPLNLGGRLPIIEYPANTARLGAFEVVLNLLDELNEIESDRVDGIQQFIQSLLVFYNVELEEDEDGNPQSPQQIREAGAIFLKSQGDIKSDLKQIADQLDQGQTQVAIDNIKQTIREIVGIPSQSDGTTGDSSNNGAVIFKTGWQGAETKAKAWELAFLPCERTFLKLVFHICNKLGGIDLNLADIDIKCPRRQYENLQVKAQVLTTMLQNPYIAPIDAYTVSCLFSDPEDAAERGLEWYEKKKKEVENDASENGRTEPPADEDEDETPDGGQDEA